MRESQTFEEQMEELPGKGAEKSEPGRACDIQRNERSVQPDKSKQVESA